MNGNKQVGFVIVGKLGTIFQLHKDIAITGHQHPHAGLFAQECLELKPDLQRNVFFCSSLQAACTRVFSAVAGINHDGRISFLPWGNGLSDWKAGGMYWGLVFVAWEVFEANGRGHINHQTRWIGEYKLFIGSE